LASALNNQSSLKLKILEWERGYSTSCYYRTKMVELSYIFI
jgi:hypothetical protein